MRNNQTTMSKPDGKYILIVEDSPSDRAVICRCIEKLNIPYKIAIDSREAIGISQESAPLLIVLDLMLPGMNGIKLAQLFKMDEGIKNAPIIVVTVLDDSRNRGFAENIGAREYLVKPVDEQAFTEAVKKYL